MLTGYRGSGKTTVGRLLAERLGRGFIDCDDLVVAAAGKSIRDIFAERGEAGFRDLEVEAVRQAAGLRGHVIALGGGALLREENRAAIAQAGHRVVYLRCEPVELLRRIEGDQASSQTRPSLTAMAGGLAEIETLLRQRDPIYRAAMTDELDVTRLAAAVVVDRLMEMIAKPEK